MRRALDVLVLVTIIVVVCWAIGALMTTLSGCSQSPSSLFMTPGERQAATLTGLINAQNQKITKYSSDVWFNRILAIALPIGSFTFAFCFTLVFSRNVARHYATKYGYDEGRRKRLAILNAERPAPNGAHQQVDNVNAVNATTQQRPAPTAKNGG